MDKFKKKKVCRVCLLPIIFYDDAWWRQSKSGKYYPLNIHDRQCRVQVIMSGENEWKVSAKNPNDITQMSLFK